jgi:hypothetical protein
MIIKQRWPTRASLHFSDAFLCAQYRRVVRRQVLAVHRESALKVRQRGSGVAAKLCRDAEVEHGVCAVPVVCTLQAGV